MRSGEPGVYVGRFAPSPSGPLHFGSLLAAVASYLEARQKHGKWLLRIENIDPPREQAGADQLIVRTLENYGFQWDGQPVYQSNTDGAHRAAAAQLINAGLAYPCGCSRRDLRGQLAGPLGTIYPGTCRNGTTADEFAVRLRVTTEPVRFLDGLQGQVTQHLESESGDFIICRRDGLIAYHLAVVVDDYEQGVTEIVRGIDLMDSTPRQIYLQRALGFGTPDYLHIPVVVNDGEQKLSKLTGAPALPDDNPGPVLAAALGALQQTVPEDLQRMEIAQIWDWAIAHWDIQQMAGLKSVAESEFPLA